MKKITSTYSIKRHDKERIPDEVIFNELARGLGMEIAKLGKLPIPTGRDDLLIYELALGALNLDEYYKFVQEKRELEAYKRLAPHLQPLIERELTEQDISRLLRNT